MTKMYIREYAELARTQQSDSVLSFPEDGTAIDSIVDYTAGVAAHTFAATTRWVVARVDSIASYVISNAATPVAAAVTNMRLNANEKIEFAIPQGLPAPKTGAAPVQFQISAITNT
jgi:hypothetical protein